VQILITYISQGSVSTCQRCGGMFKCLLSTFL